MRRTAVEEAREIFRGTTVYALFCFDPNGYEPSIYTPDPGIALTLGEANEYVKRMTANGLHAWFKTVRIGSWL